MSGPANAGLFVYAKDLEKIARFYEAVVGMKRVHATNDIVVLQNPDIQLLVHEIPVHIAENITICEPPVKRENSALKFFFTIESLEKAREIADNLGGEVSGDSWQGSGFIVCNANDPEGNIFHVRKKCA